MHEAELYHYILLGIGSARISKVSDVSTRLSGRKWGMERREDGDDRGMLS